MVQAALYIHIYIDGMINDAHRNPHKVYHMIVEKSDGLIGRTSDPVTVPWA